MAGACEFDLKIHMERESLHADAATHCQKTDLFLGLLPHTYRSSDAKHALPVFDAEKRVFF